MFCDLADSTKLSQQLDPEDLREVVRAYQHTSAEVIQRFEGYVAQHLGDGLLMYFGWPRAHEDDAQRALHTGLGIVEAITTTLNPRLEQEKGVQLTVRLGVHTGPVVVGEMGGGERLENLATGETVNIAARLEGLAQPNTVGMSSVTERLVRGAFTMEDLGTHTLKGVAEPMQVFRVLSPAEVHRDAEERMPDGGVFLVGRDEEVGLLLRRWEQSKDGLGQVVFISGEAGIGKSSLAATVRNHISREGYTRITFRCSPYHTNSALYPVITHLEQMLDFDRDDTPGTKLDKLEHVLRTTQLPLEESVPLFATLLSVPLGDRYPALTLSPQQQRQLTLDALVAWLMEETEKQPVLAVWEDLHWADPSTREMLGLVLEQTPTVPMLSVFTFRPEFTPPWPSRSHITPLALNRLERPQVHQRIAEVLEARFPETVETQPELLAHHYTAGGCPDLAVTYWQYAGEDAVQRSAHREAIGHLTQGLDLLATLSETREHAEQELAMRTTLGQSLMVTHGYTAPTLERNYLRARELCQQVDDTTQLSSVLAGLRRLYHVRAEYDTALEIGQELLRLAETHDDSTIVLWGHLGVAPPLLLTGELVAGHQHLVRCLEIYDQHAHRDLTFRYGTNPIVTCCQWMALSLWHLGYVDQAMEKSVETHRLADAFDSLFNRVIAGYTVMRTQYLQRNYEATQQYAEALLTLSTNQGLLAFSSDARVARGWALAMQGEPRAGIVDIQQGLAGRQAIGSRINRAEWLTLLAQAHEKAGQLEQGLQVLAEAQAHIDATREKIHQAEVSRLKGALLLARPLAHQSEAEACFHDAFETARQQQAKSLELRAATSLARLWQSQGKRQEASDLLAPVYAWFTEGFDTADLIDARALLDELAAS